MTPSSVLPNGLSWLKAHHSGRPIKRDVRDAWACRGVGEEVKCARGWSMGGEVVDKRSYIIPSYQHSCSYFLS